MWPRTTNPENWLPQSQFIKVISTVRIRRTGGSEIHERVAQLFVVVHTPKSGHSNCVKPKVWTVKKYETQTVDNGIVWMPKAVQER